MKKNHSLTILLLFFINLHLVGCESDVQKKQIQDLRSNLVQVNDEFINAKDLESNFSIVWKSESKFGGKDSSSRIFIDQLIERKLILQSSKTMNVIVEDSEVNSYLESLFFPLNQKDIKKKFFKKEEKLNEWLKTIREILRVNKIIQYKIYSKIQASEDEKRFFYKNNIKKYTTSRRLKVRQIVVEDKQLALEIHSQLLKGSVFSALAKEKSIGPNSFLGGVLGYLELKDLPSSLRKALENLKVGEISKVISSPSGFHVFQVTEIRSAYVKPFRSVENMIREEIIRKKGRKLLNKWILNLRKNARVIYLK